LKGLATLSPEEKKEQGGKLSSMRTSLQDAYQAKFNELKTLEINAQLEKETVDISLPGTELEEGHFSLLTKVRRELEEIAQNMGFIVESGTDIVSKFENFEAVNIPVSHPATEMHDTIYVAEKDERGENYVLRTHTSAGQNYVIKKYGVPIKAVLPGRVYRFENVEWEIGAGMKWDKPSNKKLGYYPVVSLKFGVTPFPEKNAQFKYSGKGFEFGAGL